jgi:hypothetical protein
MTIQAHLVELERKHKLLEEELHEALVHLSTDDLQIVELKRQKLLVKDQIERLKHSLGDSQLGHDSSTAELAETTQPG